MTTNKQLITNFYTAFQKRDYATMQSCYADHATFSDPVFQNLNSQEVKAMWEMLCKNGKDLELVFEDVAAEGNKGSASWTASYTFSATRNKVVNHISAKFDIEDGKIVRHNDHFSFYKWAGQALGITGWLLGWTPFMKNKVRQMAMKNLAIFMKN